MFLALKGEEFLLMLLEADGGIPQEETESVVPEDLGEFLALGLNPEGIREAMPHRMNLSPIRGNRMSTPDHPLKRYANSYRSLQINNSMSLCLKAIWRVW